MTPDPLLIPLPDAARRIGVSHDHLWREVRSGRVDHVRVGRHYRLTVEQIDAVIRKWTRPATPQPQPLRARRRRTAA